MVLSKTIYLASLFFKIAGAASFASYTAANALVPSTHESADRGNLANILPRKSIKIFYEAPKSKDIRTAAFLTFSNTIHDTVVLEHIAQISSVSCSGNKVDIQFSSDNAYEYAKSSWSAKLESGLILVSYSEGCGSNYPEQRQWLVVKSIQPSASSKTIFATYTEISPDQSAEDLDIDFGQLADSSTQTNDTIVARGDSASISKSFSFGFTPKVTDNTPFGGAHALKKVNVGKSSFGLYCVGCGASGTFKLSGHFSVKLLKFKISEANISLDGSMKAQLALALTGASTASFSLTKRIITLSLSPFSIPLIVAFGPHVTFDVGVTAALHAYGGIEYGWALQWPNIHSSIDLKDWKASSSGFTPTPKQIFQVAGEAGVDLKAYASLGVMCGVDILKGKWKADIGLVDRPQFSASGIVKKHSKAEIDALPEGTRINDGLCYSAALTNQLYAEGVFGSSTKTINLASWRGPSTSRCLHTQTVHHGPKRRADLRLEVVAAPTPALLPVP